MSDIDVLRKIEIELRDKIARLESELSRLRKVIDDAPHGQHCRAKHIGREYESGYCDCWKRTALEGK